MARKHRRWLKTISVSVVVGIYVYIDPQARHQAMLVLEALIGF